MTALCYGRGSQTVAQNDWEVFSEYAKNKMAPPLTRHMLSLAVRRQILSRSSAKVMVGECPPPTRRILSYRRRSGDLTKESMNERHQAKVADRGGGALVRVFPLVVYSTDQSISVSVSSDKQIQAGSG